jgi:predicted  nucleic acid-binding Zn-ribbon protein
VGLHPNAKLRERHRVRGGIEWAVRRRDGRVLEDLQRLIDLQKLDEQLAASEGESASLPGRRAALAEAREAAEQRVASAEQMLHEAEGEQRRAEDDLQDQEALLRKLEGQQFQVKTNEAYTALLREIEQAKTAISDSETRILEAMDAIETGSRERAAAEEQVEKVLARVAADGTALDARERELAARIAELREVRVACRASLESELLEQYEKIASRRRPAVVRVREEICLGCRVNIPPQLQIELLRGQRVITCSNCHRILIPEGAPETVLK